MEGWAANAISMRSNHNLEIHCKLDKSIGLHPVAQNAGAKLYLSENNKGYGLYLFKRPWLGIAQ
jgi:hypothetical protein